MALGMNNRSLSRNVRRKLLRTPVIDKCAPSVAKLLQVLDVFALLRSPRQRERQHHARVGVNDLLHRIAVLLRSDAAEVEVEHCCSIQAKPCPPVHLKDVPLNLHDRVRNESAMPHRSAL